MRITDFEVDNFLVHGHSSLALADVTLLVGSNGGGKSALLEALFLLGRITGRPLSNAFTEVGPLSFDARLTRGRSAAEGIRFNIGFESGGQAMQYRLAVGREDPMGRPVVLSEQLLTDEGPVFDRGNQDNFEALGLPACPRDITFLAACKRELRAARRTDPKLNIVMSATLALGRVLRFRIDPQAVARDADEPDMGLDEPRPRAPNPGPRGEGIAAFLYWLSDFERPRLRALQESLRRVIPTFDSFDFTAAEPGRIGFGVRYTDERGVVPARNLSSGTLSAIGLVCVLTYSAGGQPPVLCIEEPELGLTPAVTQAVFREILELRSERQVILTSHSPHLLHRVVVDKNALTLRAVPQLGVAAVEPFLDVIRRDAAPGTMAKLRDEGGMGVQTALRLMEDLL